MKVEVDNHVVNTNNPVSSKSATSLGHIGAQESEMETSTHPMIISSKNGVLETRVFLTTSNPTAFLEKKR